MEDNSLSYLGCHSAALIEHRSKDTGVIASIATLPPGKRTAIFSPTTASLTARRLHRASFYTVDVHVVTMQQKSKDFFDNNN